MQYAMAKTKFVRIPPRKARLAADLVRGKSVEEASLQLQFSPLKGGRLLYKTLSSAVANAETQLNVQRRDLVIHDIRVDVGPVMKRSKGKNKGGQVPVMKRTSHFTIVLSAQERG